MFNNILQGLVGLRNRTPTFQQPVNPRAEFLNQQEFLPVEQEMSTFRELADLIKNRPKKIENPSIWRKLGGVLVGMNSANPMEGTERAINARYYNQLPEYESKLKNAFDLYKAEREGRDLDRRFAADEARALRDERKLDQYDANQERLANQFTQTNERLTKQLENQQRLTDARIAQMKNPKLQYFRDTSTGTVMAYNPDTKEALDTGINHGSLSDKDKADLNLANSLQEIQARIAGNIEVANVQSSNRKEEIQKRADVREPTRTSILSEESQLEKNRKELALANRIMNTRPDLKRYIKITGTGTNQRVEIKAPLFGSDESKLREVRDLIYGAGNANLFSGNPNPGPASTPAKLIAPGVYAIPGKGQIDLSNPRPGELEAFLKQYPNATRVR